MTWLLIIALLAAAFAPVAYLMPSKRDKLLANLRALARREGLEVDVTRLPKLAAEAHERVSASGKPREAVIDCVSYGLRLASKQPMPVRYRLLRAPGGEFPVSPDSPWELDRGFKPATAPVPEKGYWTLLPGLEPLLPPDVLGLAVTDDFVLCYWQERLAAEASQAGGQGRDSAALVEDIRKLLKKIADHHGVFFAPLPPSPDD